jgi:enoyl-[acyl-carrier-protein] reductase (NADH)
MKTIAIVDAGQLASRHLQDIAQSSFDVIIEQAHSVKKSLMKELNTDNMDVIELDIISKKSIIDSIQYQDNKYGRIEALINNAYSRNKNDVKYFFDVEYDDFVQAYKNECQNKGMLDKSDLKGTLIYLLSDMSQYVNGQNIIVDDGFIL